MVSRFVEPMLLLRVESTVPPAFRYTAEQPLCCERRHLRNACEIFAAASPIFNGLAIIAKALDGCGLQASGNRDGLSLAQQWCIGMVDYSSLTDCGRLAMTR
jgi:hypothetical protein